MTNKKIRYSGRKGLTARVLILALLLMAGVNVARGQETIYETGTIEEGYYYIRSDRNLDYYLCPAQNPGNLSSGDFWNGNTATPYLTTKKQRDNYTMWYVKKIADNQYQIIHYLSGKTIIDHQKEDRATGQVVHLEAGANGNYTYFSFTETGNATSIYNIKQRDVVNNSLNPYGGNADNYTGNLIGYYGTSDNGSKWRFEKVTGICAPPTIGFSETEADNITISSATADATIYYTTDGSDPKTSGTRQSGSGTSFSISTSGVTQVKAYAVADGMTESAVTIFIPHVEEPAVIYNPSENTFSFSCETPMTTNYYYTLDGSEPTTSSMPFSTPFIAGADVKTIKVIATKGALTSAVTTYNILFQTTVDDNLRPYLIRNNGNPWSDGSKPYYLIPDVTNANTNTTSVPMARMEWYIKNAVEDGGTVYYSFQNKVTNDYLYYNGSAIVLSNSYSSSDNGFKFRIAPYPATGTPTGFNIIPYGLSSGNMYLNKSGGNTSGNAVSLYSINTDGASLWYFVLKADIDRTVPFATDGTLYKISNRSYSAAYNIITPPVGTSKVTVSNSTQAKDSPKIAWKFEVAGSDEWNTYYYIRDCETEKYLYCTATVANTYNGPDCFELWADPLQGEAERVQYIIAKSPWTDAWWIVPRLYAETQFNQICSFRMRERIYLRTDLNKGTDESAWLFTAMTPQVTDPAFAFNYTTNKVSISTDVTDGVTIYYTIDGTDPDLDNVGGENPTQLYSVPFTLSIPTTTTVKAIATKAGWQNSVVGSYTIGKVATPEFDLSAGSSLAITCATPNATIYYTTDGSTPTTASTLYRRPITEGISGKYVKAIAVKPENFPSDVAVMSEPVTLGCAAPVISRSGAMTFTLSCSFPAEGVTIYYTTDGSTPTTESTLYEGEVTLLSLPATIRAIAVADGYNQSQVAERTISEGLSGTGTAEDPYLIETNSDFDKFIEKVNGEESGAHFRVIGDFSASSAAEITKPFTGTFDGDYHTISGLNHAIFNTVSGGTVKNVMLDNVSISSGENIGAIAAEATDDSRIYNVGVLDGTVSGSGNVGSIVGLLDGSARVINCFSYATVSGGTHVGGIVGYNNYASTNADLRTMVMNCMFYGNATGTNVAPIYNGNIINNNSDKGLNNFNYFSAEDFTSAIDTYNCALGAEKRFLTRFEFYRQILNSNRELAAWYVDGSHDRSIMAKWVLETADRTITNPKPYPVLRPQAIYPSIINMDAEHAPATGEPGDGKLLGTLSVTISGVGSNAPDGASLKQTSLLLIRTDKDFDRYNFNYDKVQLPYYNDVGTGNYTENKVVTGWKITAITGGTAGTYTAADDNTGYNFADRNCTNKDLYSVTGRIFSQGAYFDVPYGVTAITIEPYWAACVYLSDPYYDKTYDKNYGGNTDNPGGYDIAVMGLRYENGQEYDINGSSQKVYTTMTNAINALGRTSGNTVYDYAVVLVGNYHHYYDQNSIKNDDNGFTIMSADLDFDNEPDNCFIYQHKDRTVNSPMRFDFLCWPGIGMAQKPSDSSRLPGIGIWFTKGWTEVTNTCIARFSEFEYDKGYRAEGTPLILQGGVFEQFVTSQGDAKKTSYIHVGGNAWFKEFNNGCHSNEYKITKHIPISVTGGDYDKFYLSGVYQSHTDDYDTDNSAECYISGGRFGEVAGAGMEGIKGNVYWQIYNADIKNFYGGGTNAAQPITGNVVTNFNSNVDVFCGGPKFGDMAKDKTVTTTANGDTFGTFFGAGYGGTSYRRYRPNNADGEKTNQFNYDWNTWESSRYNRQYDSGKKDIATSYEYEFFAYAGFSNTNYNVGRFYVNYASLSLAQTNDVTSTLTGCNITKNFYGGGNVGKVSGDATSTLTDCTVGGNVFGAGFSAAVPTVDVMPAAPFVTEPYYDENSGVYTQGVFPESVTYTWKQAESVSAGNEFDENGGHYILTTVDMTGLGVVTGKATLNIEGTTSVTGSVFGGGDASAAKGDTEVNMNSGTVQANVFGGGNVASVEGSTAVNVTGGTVNNGVYGGCNAQGTVEGDATVTLTGGTVGTAPGEGETISDAVFGGGLGEPTLVNGNVTVYVGTKSTDETPVYTGDAIINGNVYGGSALGSTNAATNTGEDAATNPLIFYTSGDNKKATTVNLYAGTINGNVFGGGLGRKAAEGVAAVESFVGGDVTVTLDGAKLSYNYTGTKTDDADNRTFLTGQIFGANNQNGTPKGHVKVHVMRTVDSTKDTETERDSRTTYDVAAVYGGGNQADYIPTNALLDPEAAEGNQALIDAATAEVIIDGCDATSIEYVYGGGNAAAVPATDVTINGSYIIDQVFGGGNGKSTDTFTNPGANIGIYSKNGTPTNYGTGIANTKLVGGKINEVFGGSNTLGNVRGGTTLKREKPEDGACELEVGEIYGAGQVAPMDGDVNIILECMPESFVDAVYGGAKNAVVNGNVSLTVTSGKYGRVFGGNNEGGSINGSITVNAYEDGCQPLIIGELYGGGNQAPYSIWGCNDDNEDDTWTPNTPDPEGTPHVAADTIAVSVNVYSCTSIGKVFGGGYGSTATVVGNTHVYINMMKGIVNEVTQENIGKIGQVFGGGNQGLVKGNTLIDIGTTQVTDALKTGYGVNIESGSYLKPDKNENETLTAGVYGGGNAADVKGNTTLNIGTADQDLGVNIAGDIFGGGYGETTTVTGDVVVNIGKRVGTTVNETTTYTYYGYANITGDVYGGSAKGKVNATKGEGSTFTANEGKTTQVNLYGGTIQDTDTPSGKGNIYGGGLGEDNEGTSNDYAADVYGPVTVNVEGGHVNNVFGCNNVLGTPKNTVAVNINGGTVNNSVYGGGNMAAYTPVGVTDYPAVNVAGGLVTDNVFGGGLGTTATVTSDPHVTISDNADIRKSVYGGGEQAQVSGSTFITVSGGRIGTPKDGDTYYGGATYGNVYGGGLGVEGTPTAGLVSGNTNITVSGGTVLHNIYGGGAYGSVGTYTFSESNTTCAENTGDANITITGGTIGIDGHENGMVFGSARGDVSAPGGAHDLLAWVNNTNVIIGTAGQGSNVSTPSIKGSVYGGGENGHTYNNTSVTIHSGMVGITDTSIDGGAAYAYRGNVYGGGCGTDKYVDTEDENKEKYNEKAGIVSGTSTVTINGGHVVRNVYGGGAMGSVTGGTTVNISGNSVIGASGSDGGNVYAAARGDEALTDASQAYVGSTSLTIAGGTIWGSAFGGGQSGIVKGDVNVTVSGGEVKNDVYGGGALANTNTDNWNGDGSAITYVEVTDLTEGTTSVAGYYTRSGSEGSYIYTLVTDGKAVAATTYYRKKVVGTWADGKNDASTGTKFKTTVNLIGGLIGNAYGGGLGQLANGDNPAAEGYKPAIAAMVYGDVKITVNDPSVIGSAPGVAFTQNTTNITYGEGDKRKEYVVPLTGRVFGCNNQNGTPTGNVRVEVHSTRQIDADNNIISGHGSSNRKYPNEIRAVYGGGNLSDYLPADGKATSVYIDGCDVTSIEKVYGGGNSATVPATDVTINACYDIGYAFGGGNGGDLIYKNDEWIENEGAIVIGLAKIAPKGGKIGQVFGGSDAKGVCGSTTVDLSQKNNDCPLVLTRIYGAGNESDVASDVNMIISGCTSESQTIGGETIDTQIEYVYGGSYNANITGHVTLTITSGTFKYVYGGNDRTGSIGGNITVNIEETENCKPVIIENLLGGGNEAAYPGTMRNGTEITTPGKITVNVKSATYIGSVYGGSYKADVNGDTEVNINMTKGLWAGAQAPAGYSDLPNVNHASYAKVVSPTADDIGTYYEKSGDTYTTTSDAAIVSGKTYYVAVAANTDVIDDAVGVIGTVYGGGNQGVVRGSSVVNIGTSTTVQLIDVVTKDGEGKITNITYKDVPVLGARITGDVFGGGNEANVNTDATVNICTVSHSGTTGFEGINIESGSVYGGGNASDVLGNTSVTMAGGYVFDGVYGGGLMGSVGTVSSRTDGKPNFAENTGKCTVVISGGQVGPVEVALADGGMKNTARHFKATGEPNGPVDYGFVFGAGRGEVEDPATDPDADFRTYVNETEVIIKNKYEASYEGGAADSLSHVVSKPIIMASVYGGGENGRVRGNTLVKIYGGQIGCGEGKVDSNNKPVAYTEAQWTAETPGYFTECASWDYGKEVTIGTVTKKLYLPYDPYAPADALTSEASTVGSDGHTYYGCVFGGGSGYYPYLKADGTHDWLRSAGLVEGSTKVLVSGGHILTNIYGGNELTDVTGDSCVVIMTGGTLGVPRTDDDALKRPVTCYLFGGGKGDQRPAFEKWTNVKNTRVYVGGNARIFGSVFGGAEDGHVEGNAKVGIYNGMIGSTGTSYVDGNVFGGGRGFSGECLTAGAVYGNASVTISDGTMLGSIYGGGRMASVGISDEDDHTNPMYGQLKDDTASEAYGHITVNISGGTIGNDVANAQYGGNVFGGSMGRLDLLDGSRNPLWPKLASVKLTDVTVSGGEVKRNVYGGGEYGVVRNRATVNIKGGTVNGSVFGSGYGSLDTLKTTVAVAGYNDAYYTLTPMLFAGCVSGSTFVNVSGGWVKTSVYGGGEYASVGLIDFASDEEGNFTNIFKHDDATKEFALSWPYKFTYHAAAQTDTYALGENEVGSKATVEITGGRIGITGKDYIGPDTNPETGAAYTDAEKKELRTDNGDVYGGSKGVAGDRYTMAFCANVRETEVNVKYDESNTATSTNYTAGVDLANNEKGDNDCIAGSVYGGGENGHVYENTRVTLTNGLIGHAIYGGGKGKDTYHVTATDKKLKDFRTDSYIAGDIYSITAGKVYGNTSVTMSGGYVMRNIYGGGNMASVGKGSYACSADDYISDGYGENITSNLWDNESDDSKAFLSSGIATVTVTGGTVGTDKGEKDDLPTGNIYGGCRGEAGPNIIKMPIIDYNPTFQVGTVNETNVTIGTSGATGTAGTAAGFPRIYGSVYGGGQDGHTRRDTKVTVYAGEIGNAYTSTNQAKVGTSDQTHMQWLHRGNVYGSGSGIGQFEYDYDGNGSIDPNDPNEKGCNYLAGRVARFCEVDIQGGIIHRNVYGGGSVAGTGSPNLAGRTFDPDKKGDNTHGGVGFQSQNTVSISGGTIGEATYGGNVFGASRGEEALALLDNTRYANVVWTDVTVSGGTICNNVYGGGELGTVRQSTEVQLTGGSIAHDAYGGGKGTNDIAADVGGNATVELNKGKTGSDPGCSLQRIFGCNDLNGTPRGHVKVYVHATRHPNTTKIVPDGGKYAKYEDVTTKTNSEHNEYLQGLATTYGVTLPDGYATTIAKNDYADIEGANDSIKAVNLQIMKNKAFDQLRSLISDKKYDVLAVYGGGNLAEYKPYGPARNGMEADYKATTENTEVIIDGCDLTSIKQVYGGGNAAPSPATSVLVNAAYEIDEVFGGGNGKDNYQIGTTYYENPGANVGYYNYTHYVKSSEEDYSAGTHGSGTSADPYKAIENDDADNKTKRQAYYRYGRGVASTEIAGGRIHFVYGGSNEKGNISTTALSIYDTSIDCPVVTDKTYGAGKNAEVDAEVITQMECVNYTGRFFGGSTSADVNSDVTLTITNGHFNQVFGGNDTSGKINGSITVRVKEESCQPIVINELYGGGYLAGYSIYGYNADNSPRTKAEFETAYTEAIAECETEEEKTAALVAANLIGLPYRNPRIEIISASKIGTVYGGGYNAQVIGSPSINVNMENGTVPAKYANEEEKAANFTVGEHTITSDGGGEYTYYVASHPAGGDATLAIGTIGTIFGGGNQADIDGSTTVEIGTGKHLNDDEEEEVITPARNAAFITGRVYGGGDQGYVKGNAAVNIGNGYIYDRVYGGGNEGTVGTVSTRAALPDGHATHDNCLKGKPTAFAANTGKTTVTVSGGYVGPFSLDYATNQTVATPTPMSMTKTGGPDDFGHVFGAGRGKMADPTSSGNEDLEFMTYVDTTEVHISGTALIAGSVYGGAENGRVLNDTHVYIEGGQIGLGATKTTAYAEADYIDPTDPEITASDIETKAAAMPECAHWDYRTPWMPYDAYAGKNYGDGTASTDASTTGTDGHTFYGNVFGGGSGYSSYLKIDETTDDTHDWLPSAGMVEGDTYVNISGGHILTSAYGGNEMTDVLGDCHVTMTGGTLGVPRTLDQIAAHPVTCYLFGAGKGDPRVHFNKGTNVQNTEVTVSGGIIYGSVFGGGEDGHVLGNATVNIETRTTGEGDEAVTTSPVIGTWGTSYVDGNIFGGGRGFSGESYTQGNVGGSVTVNITGGTMLGSIYGGGRLGSVGYGLFNVDEDEYGVTRADDATEAGLLPPGGFTKGRGHIEVSISGDNTVIGNKYEYVVPEAGNIPDGLSENFKNWSTTDWATWRDNNHVPSTTYDTSTGRLLFTRGGNVFVGGMGRPVQLDGVTPISTYNAETGALTSAVDWTKLGCVKSTKLTVSGNPWIMSNVYGGGMYGAVTGSHTLTGGTTPTGTEITITGGTIGTEVTGSTPVKATVDVPESGNSSVKYTFGSVYGGGMGSTGYEGGYGGAVADTTRVSISGAGTKVRASVFGGGEIAEVGGNTHVTVSGGEIGRNEVRALDDTNPGYVMFGGATMGNVYGGGKGELGETRAGQVKGNTNVLISGGSVYHNVYGGGALASVGTFSVSTGEEEQIPVPGVPYGWTSGTGTATVNITGGTIGISGRDNGLVFGSSRGDLKAPEELSAGISVDPYDLLAWVNNSVVNIGSNGTNGTNETNGSDESDGSDGSDESDGTSGASGTPHIKGSVYGGGENGHNSGNAMVNVYSGTIGISDDEDTWYQYTDATRNADAQAHRGNVYGGGSGADTYTGVDGQEYHNPESGMVGGNTTVNIAGGHIGRSVYGGGAISSVGTITNLSDTTGVAKHADANTSFALSWPYQFEFQEGTGKATVNVTGGHIGTRQIDGGDVFGSSRGEAGDRYVTAHLAYVKETEVNISYPKTAAMTSEDAIYRDYDIQCVTGSVHGSGEDGFVYGDAHVTLNNGLVGHSVYGAGKGKGTYTKTLNKIGGSGTYDAKIYSLIAGKVFGNTYVTMNGGHVGRNVYGGGNLASVGKGNYAGGADDYTPDGYGETLNGNDNDNDKKLWTPSSDFAPDQPISTSNTPTTMADYFLSSGKTTVKVLGGTVGFIDEDNPSTSMKNNLIYGNVFGGSAGVAAPNVPQDLTPRYEYCPAFFSGYVNETDVTIGGSNEDYEANKANEPYKAYETYEVYLDSGAPKILGSVYGGGQDGHVRRDTKVTVYAGEIGLPYNSDNQELLQATDPESPLWLHRGNVYGGGSGISEYESSIEYADGYNPETGYSTSAGSVTRFTEVNILGGTIHRNVYGGGSMGSVGAVRTTQDNEPYKKGDTAEGHGAGRQSQNTVNIGGGESVVTIGDEASVAAGYGGNVFGASRGDTKLDPDPVQFALSVWTLVNIKDKSTILGNVFGGGDNGEVKKDAEVIVGGDAN